MLRRRQRRVLRRRRARGQWCRHHQPAATARLSKPANQRRPCPGRPSVAGVGSATCEPVASGAATSRRRPSIRTSSSLAPNLSLSRLQPLLGLPSPPLSQSHSIQSFLQTDLLDQRGRSILKVETVRNMSLSLSLSHLEHERETLCDMNLNAGPTVHLELRGEVGMPALNSSFFEIRHHPCLSVVFINASPRFGEIHTVSIGITGYVQTSTKSRFVTVANRIPSATWTPVPCGPGLCSCCEFKRTWPASLSW